MPDSLNPILTELERKYAADRLWDIVKMIDAGKSPSDVRYAVKWVAQEIESPLLSTPVNLDERRAA